MPSLASLPPEVILEIARHLTSLSDLATLTAICRSLNAMTAPFLYWLAAESHPHLLSWASELGFLNVVRSLLNAGADPNHPVKAKPRCLTAAMAHAKVKSKDLLHTTYTHWPCFSQYDGNTELGFRRNPGVPKVRPLSTLRKVS